MKYILFLFLITYTTLIGQIKVKDLASSEPIPFVTIYNEHGNFIGATTTNGEIDDDLKKRILSQSEYIVLKSSFYQPKNVLLTEITNIQAIFLKPLTFALDEVVVTSNTKLKFLKISGYYRSTQLNNNQIQYFNDGLIDFYIDLTTAKIYPNKLTNRAYKNTDIKQMGKNLHFSVVGVPNIFELKTEPVLSTKVKINNQLTEKTTIYNDSTNKKQMNLLGNTSILNRYLTTKMYNTTDSTENLVYYSELRDYQIKSKKELQYTTIEAFHEFFVTDVSYTNIKEKSNCRYYVFTTEKNYEQPFWQDIKNTVFTATKNSNQKFGDSLIHL